ncbi:MAG: DoxX family membrane protein [Gammaproteobacteria bacterium]|nr:DoxX family membrane protein [Gammaproteobacteria bacterium]
MTIDPVIVVIARLAIGWLFLFGALHKLRDVTNFKGVLAAYRLLPAATVGFIAWSVALAEVAIGIAALLQLQFAFIAAAAVLACYAVAMTVNVVRGRRFIDCGCGGDAQPITWGLIVRNLLLVGFCGLALMEATARSFGWIDLGSIGFGVIVCGLIYGAVNQLLAAQARLEEWV